MSAEEVFKNPFRPGAGHYPPHLAGREREQAEFERLLQQDVILKNLVLTGLRGVGKTVFLEKLKALAVSQEWLWVGTEVSESVSVSEQSMAIRLLADLSTVTASVKLGDRATAGFGTTEQSYLTYDALTEIYASTPGLVSDKLKSAIELSWRVLSNEGRRGLIFAYDEAQNLSDNRSHDEYPLSVALDVFQSLQRKNLPIMLVLTGLPTILAKLVDTRTYSERMFRVLTLDKLSKEESRDAILVPIQTASCPVVFNDQSVETVSDNSGGYPYFIQFMCREVYDIFLQQVSMGEEPSVPVDYIIEKLDTDFFAGRWTRATDRQRDLLLAIARLGKAENEFTVQEVVTSSEASLKTPFSPSRVGQMLVALADAGLIYKNRFGKYSFAVPLMDRFILRIADVQKPTSAPAPPSEQSPNDAPG